MSTLPILTLTTGRWSTQQQVEHAHDMNASLCEWSEKHYVLKLTIILIFVNVFISKGVQIVTNPNFQLFGISSYPQRRVQMLRGKFKFTALFAQRKPRRSAYINQIIFHLRANCIMTSINSFWKLLQILFTWI